MRFTVVSFEAAAGNAWPSQERRERVRSCGAAATKLSPALSAPLRSDAETRIILSAYPSQETVSPALQPVVAPALAAATVEPSIGSSRAFEVP